MSSWNIGDICYFIENEDHIRSGIITKISGEFCIIKYKNTAATRLRMSRLYHSETEAKDHFKVRKLSNPYKYM